MVRGLSIFASVAALAFAISGGCSGTSAPLSGGTDDGNDQNANDPYAPCTDYQDCCPSDEVVCYGDVDGHTQCTCPKLWECNPDKTKCTQPVPFPDGSGNWRCEDWNEFTGITCKRPGSEGEVPTGSGDWSCVYNQEMQQIVCTSSYPPNPPNSPTGTGEWKCEITESEGPQRLVCERPPPGTSGGNNSSGGQPGTWEEVPGGSGVFKRTDQTGIPTGGGNWVCHEESIGGTTYIACLGDSENNPGGSGGWNCEKVPNEFNRWFCRREKDQGDTPPGGSGTWECVRGSEFGGTICTEVPDENNPDLNGGDVCVPNKEYWCDGGNFCGWGIIKCKPDGTFPTEQRNGRTVLACYEQNGVNTLRPDTACGCYYFFFNPKCCELDAIKTPYGLVCPRPDGAVGRVCERSAGNVCDYCTPGENTECKEGICAVSPTLESFCTKHCGADGSCPTNMVCMDIQTREGQVSKECIPSDFSAYDGC